MLVYFSGEEQFYPTGDTLIQGGHYPTSSALDRMSDAANGMYAIYIIYIV